MWNIFAGLKYYVIVSKDKMVNDAWRFEICRGLKINHALKLFKNPSEVKNYFIDLK